MTTHTPGPWAFVDDVIESNNESIVYFSPDGEPWKMSQTDTANGRLIASAPDLLSACQMSYEATNETLNGAIDNYELSRVADSLARAIAKAKGQ